MSLLQEFLFDPTDRKIPLDQPPLENLPQWGHWLETPEYMVAIVPPGHLEVNLRSPFNLVVTSFGLTQWIWQPEPQDYCVSACIVDDTQAVP